MLCHNVVTCAKSTKVDLTKTIFILKYATGAYYNITLKWSMIADPQSKM